ncbi:MAG: rod shape-determining protein RodA [Candidatus Uhrbacteria bacterium]
MRFSWTKLRRVDGRMLLATLVLISLGFSAIYSITLSQNGQGFLLIQKQFIALGLGLLLAIFVAWSNYRWTQSYVIPFYILTNLALVAVLFLGETIRGTTGWFSLFGFHFQPVELAKLCVIVVLARYFSGRGGDISWRELAESGAIVGLPVFLTLCQPDLGSALLLVGIWSAFLFFAGLKFKHILLLVLVGVVSLAFSWQFLFADYQKARLVSFIDPTNDPMGQGYNVQQAIIAVGSGGLFGRGLGFGSQSQLKFIPESQTDFIFAVIAEEFGLVGVLLLFGAFFLLLHRLLKRARLTRDDFTSFLLLGIAALFLISFLVNVGMNLGLLPVTGIALPFVSYGGSALMMSLIMVGLAQSVVIHDVTAKQVLIERK